MRFFLAILCIVVFSTTQSYSQIKFAQVTNPGVSTISTSNQFNLIHPIEEGAVYPLFYSMKQWDDGKIYFVRSNSIGYMETDGSNYTIIATLSANIWSEICFGADGKIYVSTSDNKLYRVSRDGSSVDLIASITVSLTLISTSDGWLFGSSSGIVSKIFKIRTDGSNYTELRVTTPETEGGGAARMVLAPNNVLYGIFGFGGPNARGTIFKIDTSGNNFQVLSTSADANMGVGFSGNPTYQNGKIFFNAVLGGAYSKGVILSLDTNGTSFNKIFDYGNPSLSVNGAGCQGGLIGDAIGNLYGATSTNAKIFRISEDGQSISTVFAPDPSTFYFTESFDLAPILLNNANTLVFQSPANGFNLRGFIYRVNKDGSNPSLVYNHGYNANGVSPSQGVVRDAQNYLYGATIAGGTGGGGILYKIRADGTNFSIIHHFTGLQARYPNGRLLLASDGKLYGVCKYGSNPSNIYKGGCVYRINTDGTGFEIIKQFDNNGTIYNPRFGLIEGPSGELYGQTDNRIDGSEALSIFKIQKDGSGFQILRTLDPNVEGKLGVEALSYSDGFLYGTTRGGALFESGSIFRLEMNGNSFQVLRQFARYTSDGGEPTTGLTIANDEKLYGATFLGGTFSGILYRINKDGSNYEVMFDLDINTHGMFINGKFVPGPNGLLYATTSNGAANGKGTFFSFNPSTKALSIIRTFGVNEGGSFGELVLIPTGASLPVTLKDFKVQKFGNNQAKIQWATEKEINFEKFIVEKSLNGEDFTELASFYPKPTTGLTDEYEAIDLMPGQSKVYYRLKMVDLDKTFSYSKIRFLDFTSNNSKLSIYPNPARGIITISNEFKGSVITISIVDNTGRLVYNKTVPRTSALSIDISNLAKGMYHLTASDSKEKALSVFIKE